MTQYRMTDEEFARLKESCKPVPYMVFGGKEPTSPRENAMAVWATIATRVGCVLDTIGPSPKGDQQDFLAEPNAS
jgi:hypothetical protein